MSITYASSLGNDLANGTTDAGPILASTILALKPGDVFVFDRPTGSSAATYLTSKEIILPDQVTLRGSEGVVLKVANGAGASMRAMIVSQAWSTGRSTGGAPVVIEGLGLNGNRANNAGTTTHGMLLMNWQSLIKSNKIVNTTGDAIRFTSRGASGADITNTCVNSRIEKNDIDLGSGGGIVVVDSAKRMTDFMIVGNFVGRVAGDGISSSTGAGAFVTGNHIFCQGTSIKLDRCWATSVSTNYIDGFGSQPVTGPVRAYSGIQMSAMPGAGSVCHGNVVNFGPGSLPDTHRGILISSTGAGLCGVTLTSNEVTGPDKPTAYGIQASAWNGSALTLTTSGNSVRGIGGPRILSIGTGVTRRADI